MFIHPSHYVFRNISKSYEEKYIIPQNTTSHVESPAVNTIKRNKPTVEVAKGKIVHLPNLTREKEQIVIPLSKQLQLGPITIKKLHSLGSILRKKRQYQLILALTSEGVHFYFFLFKIIML